MQYFPDSFLNPAVIVAGDDLLHDCGSARAWKRHGSADWPGGIKPCLLACWAPCRGCRASCFVGEGHVLCAVHDH